MQASRALVLGLIGGLTVAVGSVAEPTAVPNMLLIIAEDLSPRLGAYGDTLARTPHIDRLAEQGTRYTRVFTSAGVCAPSRAGLMTARHAIGWGGQHMRTSSRPAGGYAAVPPPDLKAFPEWLRAAGVYTYNVQKTDYQFSGTMGGGPFTMWDESGIWVEGDDWPRDQAFLGVVNLGVTHESGIFPPLGHMPRNGIHFVMQLIRGFQFWGSAPDAEPTDPAAVTLPPYYPDHPDIRSDLARHYDNIAAMDLQVGALLEQLEADGLADSTIVVWTTDHGDGLPRAKRELFDSGLHVPMIVHYPEALRPANAPPGGVDGRLISWLDLGPTILDWMSVPLPAPVDGRSFADRTTPGRQYVFAARDRIDDQMDRQRAVRDERFKYIRSWYPELPGGHRSAFRENQDGVRALQALQAAGELDAVQRRWFEPNGRERLFDTRADPHELNDLSADPAHAETLVRLRAALDDWLARVGDTSEEPEDAMVERFWPGGEQPVTEPPTLEERDGRVVLSSPTPGASIGLRIAPARDWSLYAGPFESPGGGREIEAKAVRYGWAESDVASWPAP